MCLNEDEIAQRLSAALGSDERPLLSGEQVTRRTRAIVEEVPQIGFDVRPFAWINATPGGNIHPYPAYHIDDPRYDLDNTGPGERGPFAINCPGISCGDLLKFGRACELKQEHLEQWPGELRKQLIDPQQHLDALEEIQWLGRFTGLNGPKAKFVQPNGKDADWVFETGSRRVQIEVKNKRGEWSGMLDGSHRNREFSSWYNDLNGKFFRHAESDVNLACITTYFDADDSLWERAAELLTSDPAIDGVVIWATFSRNGSNLSALIREEIRPFLPGIFAPITREDAFKVLVSKHLLRNSDERRIVTLQEGIEQSVKLVREFSSRSLS